MLVEQLALEGLGGNGPTVHLQRADHAHGKIEGSRERLGRDAAAVPEFGDRVGSVSMQTNHRSTTTGVPRIPRERALHTSRRQPCTFRTIRYMSEDVQPSLCGDERHAKFSGGRE